MTLQIGLFGGTFDPPHNGHLALVRAGLELMGLDEVWVLPAAPVHRQLSGHADGAMRLAWVEEIFAGMSGVRVLGREVKAGRAVPAVETLRWFAGEHPGLVPWLMLGADAWAGLPTWREYPQHRGLCNAAVFARKGEADAAPLAGWQACGLNDWRRCTGPGHWLDVAADLPEISATVLRGKALAGKSLAGTVPDAVCSRIEAAYRGG